MICSECGRIIEFFSAELEALQDKIAAKHRFQITQHLHRIIASVAECRRAAKEAGKQGTDNGAGALHATARAR